MSDKSDYSSVGRRKFLAGVAGAGAAALPADSANAQSAKPPAPTPRGVAPPTAAQVHAEQGVPAALPATSALSSGGDFMVDVLKSLKLEYIFSNPGSSFRGLHESVINYGNNRAPEFITCMHEESSAGMAHGYAKAAGSPAAIFVHGTVGLQHATMGLYNAWCDRAPILTVLGNQTNAVNRRPNIDWVHAAQDPAAIVRDYTKWDDQPASLQHFADSTVRAYRLATTSPMAPVAIVADLDLQEMELRDRKGLTIPKVSPNVPPQGDSNAIREVARLLVAAERPVIIADRCARTPAGMSLLVELAELLTCPVVDQGGRPNFPNWHYLSQTAQLYGRADVILGLEVWDFYSVVNQFTDNAEHTTRVRTAPGVKLISIGVGDLLVRANYQDFQRYAPTDLAISADAEATLPSLIEAVKSALSNERRAALATRADGFRKAHTAAFERARTDTALVWDLSPVSPARVAAELWELIKNEDWALVSPTYGGGRRLWNFDKHYRHIGGSGGQGVGYGLPSAVGAALAHRPHGRLCVNIQADGDFMYANGALWTAAHHQIPLLTVMFNNRAYHQEIMHLQRIASRWNRGIDQTHIGTTIDNPNIDYAKIAQGLGVWAEGPIIDPKDLAPALRRAIQVVKRGQPALVDVVSQPR